MARNDGAAFECRGVAWKEKGNYGKAIADLTEAIRLNSMDSSAYHNRADVWFAQKEYSRAIADYDEAIRLNPECKRAFVETDVAGDNSAAGAGAPTESVAVVCVSSSGGASYSRRGQAWAAKGELDKAIADFDEALRLNPETRDALVARKEALDKKESQARLEQFRKSGNWFPEKPKPVRIPGK